MNISTLDELPITVHDAHHRLIASFWGHRIKDKTIDRIADARKDAEMFVGMFDTIRIDIDHSLAGTRITKYMEPPRGEKIVITRHPAADDGVLPGQLTFPVVEKETP